MRPPALLALKDGSLFYGTSIGSEGLSVGELVFNTAMTGYQEILTDPSYAQQIVTLTYPHIGNTGVNLQDMESEHIWATGLVIRDLPLLSSHWQQTQSLDDYLAGQKVLAIADIDTRQLTRHLRHHGAMGACIMAGTVDAAQAIAAAGDFPGLAHTDLAKVVSTTQVKTWSSADDGDSGPGPVIAPLFHIVAYDFGVKHNILRMMAQRNCRITLVPATTTVEQALQLAPDGLFFSNGPGDPQACAYAIDAVAQFMHKDIPLFGICLGFQLMALASGAQTYKMKFGHHGANHPVKCISDEKVLITSQNHGFAVDEASLSSDFTVTHRSLFDGSLQGIHHKDKPFFGFQGHPEASPGPREASAFFDHFIDLMEQFKRKYY